MCKPKSAMEIASESKIPISTVYRRLQTLYDNKLVKISGSISEDGKKYFLYKSKIKAISISCDCNDLEITIVPNIEVSEYLERNYVGPNAR
jgi:predicted transcriptional regulator